ncbi:MAG: carboxypeptidase T [Alteromonadaceae bacterium]|jgi:carboxypeptidase T
MKLSPIYPYSLKMQVLISLKTSSTALHSILIASYYSIMHLVAKIFSHVQNHAPSMTTGIYTRLFLICLALSSFFSLASNTTTKTPALFSKITYADVKIANKILISLHHSVMEINRDENYLIATLNEQEKNLLIKQGLTISPAIDWQEKFEYHQKIRSIKHDKKLNKDKDKSQSQQGIDNYQCYPTVEETYQQAEALAEQYPLLTNWLDIGDSWNKTNKLNGYDLMVLKITNTEFTAPKPILFIHSSMHAREYAPAALNLDFAKWLLNNYRSNAEAQWLVNHREIHLLFHMNPDGRKIAESQILQRKNTNQNHCASSTVGVDLNRNFAQTWNTTANGSSGDECSETYRGISAESEPETQAVSHYIRTLFPDERGLADNDPAPKDKSGLHLDIHSYGELVLWPYGHTDALSPNNDEFIALGNKFAWFNDYTAQQAIGLYATDGTSDNVSYGELGVAALTFELGDSFFQNCATYANEIKPDNLNALIYAAKVSQAPYLLPAGPDIASINVNKSNNQTEVTVGTPITLDIIATNSQSKLNVNNTISAIEYSIDQLIWAKETTPEILLGDSENNEGNTLSSTQIDTSTMTIGQHIIYVRAKNNVGQYGVPNAIFFNIGERNSPQPIFSISCQDLTCDFDASASISAGSDITSYRWLFSDAITSEGVIAKHTFTNAGNKTATLIIENIQGAQAQSQQNFAVSAIEIITVTPQLTSKSSGGSVYGLFALLILFLRSRLNAVVC